MAPSERKSISLLFIDDSPEDTEFFRRLLRPTPDDDILWEVSVAHTVREGVALYQSQTHDCVLLDLNMPEANGIETLEVLSRISEGKVCAVIMTGSGNETSAVAAMQRGAMDYLVKGEVRAVSLRRAVRNAIEKKSMLLAAEAQREALKAANEQLREQQRKTSEALRLVALDNQRKTRELNEARQLQLSLLPERLPRVPELDMAATMIPCHEVGGDYYDYRLGKGKSTLVIGDATGHGLRAGIVVATVKSYFHTAPRKYKPADMLRRISQGIRNLQVRQMYMGLTIARFENHRMHLASAGMPPLYWYRASSHTVEKILLPGVFLGSNLQEQYSTYEMELAPNDVLMAMTDGLPERFNEAREQLGYERIVERLLGTAERSAAEIMQEMIQLGDEWGSNHPPEDDVTLLVVKAQSA